LEAAILAVIMAVTTGKTEPILRHGFPDAVSRIPNMCSIEHLTSRSPRYEKFCYRSIPRFNGASWGHSGKLQSRESEPFNGMAAGN
jgi:hypothetical protein